MGLKITPYENRILVRPVNEASQGELALLDTSKQRPQTGIVIEVGPGRNGIPMMTKKGDQVFYRMGAGIPIPADLYPGEDKLLIMTEGSDTLLCISIPETLDKEMD